MRWLKTWKIMIEQQTPEITVIGFSNGFFFKCPMGGYASLRPGLCPKCNEPLVAIAPLDSRLDEQPSDARNHKNGRRFAVK